MVKTEENIGKPTAKRLKVYNFEKLNEEFEKKEKVIEFSRCNVSKENYRKLEAISATKNISIDKIINPLLDEKIMNINVVEYVENLENIKLVSSGFLGTTYIMGIKLSSEGYRRLKIFSGVKNVDPGDFVENFLDELIKEIDLVKLIKEEFC